MMHLRAAWEHNRLKADRSYVVRLLLNEQHKTKAIKKINRTTKTQSFFSFLFLICYIIPRKASKCSRQGPTRGQWTKVSLRSSDWGTNGGKEGELCFKCQAFGKRAEMFAGILVGKAIEC